MLPRCVDASHINGVFFESNAVLLRDAIMKLNGRLLLNYPELLGSPASLCTRGDFLACPNSLALPGVITVCNQ